jgi:predicted DNA-binding mobile mystery protein A
MRNQDRLSARRRLDQRFEPLRNSRNLLTPPPVGWIRVIRDAIGMTAAQLAKRLGVSQQRALVIEQAETSGSITLASLARAADALDCELIYAVVPRTSLERLVEDRAAKLARDRGIAKVDEKLLRHLVALSGSRLWE